MDLKNKIKNLDYNGFTLVEMLTVLVIIGLILSMLFPSLQKARQRGRRIKTESEVRELTKAWNAYWFTYGSFPSSGKITMDADNVRILQGDNPQGIVFMNFPEGADQDGFFDPWGEKLYVVELMPQNLKDTTWVYETKVYVDNNKKP